jgi:hypothetical protein
VGGKVRGALKPPTLPWPRAALFASNFGLVGGRMTTGVHSLMKNCVWVFVVALMTIGLAIPSVAQKEKIVTQHAAGTFDVKLQPQGEADKAEGSTLARYSLDKQYHGDLAGTSQGTMLTAGTEVQGSAGYVAIERVTGTLQGRAGSFVLQHSGTLTRGEPQQSIAVVPDSGAGQLLGLTGRMTIIIAAGKHSYEFDYTLPAAP